MREGQRYPCLWHDMMMMIFEKANEIRCERHGEKNIQNKAV